MDLKVLQNTIFKQSTESSSKLPETGKVSIAAGRVFAIHSWKALDAKHIRVAILGEKLGKPERNTWCVFRDHVELISSQGANVQPPDVSTPDEKRLPESCSLNIPHKSQLDNDFNPTGSCNVTSFSMAMTYFQLTGKTRLAQLEDELYHYMESNRLSRHEPEGLVKMAAAYGLKSDFTPRGSLSDIRKAIAAGYPCIVHGYFTSFGHIVLVRGYNKYGFFVNDPYGEWTSSGYLTNLPGENLHYSNGLIQNACSPEGENYIWLHRLSKL